MAHIMAQNRGLKQDPPVIKVYSRNNEDDNDYVCMLYPKQWRTRLKFNTVQSQGRGESHNARGKDKYTYKQGRSSQGYKRDKPRLPGLGVFKNACCFLLNGN